MRNVLDGFHEVEGPSGLRPFKITYVDPETGDQVEVRKSFEGFRSAEDYAYTLADKGWYQVRDVSGKLPKTRSFP